MSKGTIIKYTSIVVGSLIAISFVSKHPVPIILLGICAGAYFVGAAIEKGNINL
jgi:glutamine amidotransferase-like uncharacterized protein